MMSSLKYIIRINHSCTVVCQEESGNIMWFVWRKLIRRDSEMCCMFLNFLLYRVKSFRDMHLQKLRPQRRKERLPDEGRTFKASKSFHDQRCCSSENWGIQLLKIWADFRDNLWRSFTGNK